MVAQLVEYLHAARLLHYLQGREGIFPTETVPVNRVGGAALKSINEVDKYDRGKCDTVTDVNSHIYAVRWKDNKVVTAVSTYSGKEPLMKAKRYSRVEQKHVEINQSYMIYSYNKKLGDVDRMEQNLA